MHENSLDDPALFCVLDFLRDACGGSLWSKAVPYVDTDRRRINFAAMLKQEVFSDSEQTMVRIAWSLWSLGAPKQPKVSDLYCGGLDDGNFELVIEALRRRRAA